MKAKILLSLLLSVFIFFSPIMKAQSWTNNPTEEEITEALKSETYFLYFSDSKATATVANILELDKAEAKNFIEKYGRELSGNTLLLYNVRHKRLNFSKVCGILKGMPVFRYEDAIKDRPVDNLNNSISDKIDLPPYTKVDISEFDAPTDEEAYQALKSDVFLLYCSDYEFTDDIVNLLGLDKKDAKKLQKEVGRMIPNGSVLGYNIKGKNLIYPKVKFIYKGWPVFEYKELIQELDERENKITYPKLINSGKQIFVLKVPNTATYSDVAKALNISTDSLSQIFRDSYVDISLPFDYPKEKDIVLNTSLTNARLYDTGDSLISCPVYSIYPDYFKVDKYDIEEALKDYFHNIIMWHSTFMEVRAGQDLDMICRALNVPHCIIYGLNASSYISIDRVFDIHSGMLLRVPAEAERYAHEQGYAISAKKGANFALSTMKLNGTPTTTNEGKNIYEGDYRLACLGLDGYAYYEYRISPRTIRVQERMNGSEYETNRILDGKFYFKHRQHKYITEIKGQFKNNLMIGDWTWESYQEGDTLPSYSCIIPFSNQGVPNGKVQIHSDKVVVHDSKTHKPWKELYNFAIVATCVNGTIRKIYYSDDDVHTSGEYNSEGKPIGKWKVHRRHENVYVDYDNSFSNNGYSAHSYIIDDQTGNKVYRKEELPFDAAIKLRRAIRERLMRNSIQSYNNFAKEGH